MSEFKPNELVRWVGGGPVLLVDFVKPEQIRCLVWAGRKHDYLEYCYFHPEKLVRVITELDDRSNTSEG